MKKIVSIRRPVNGNAKQNSYELVWIETRPGGTSEYSARVKRTDDGDWLQYMHGYWYLLENQEIIEKYFQKNGVDN